MENLGDLESRFHKLLKYRLKTEIELNPPLFPWETTISDYESESIEDLPLQLIPSPQSSWMIQLAQLSLPVPLPAKVLTQLLEACSEAMHYLQPQPAKMVSAVSSLFPNQFHLLNEKTKLVLLSANHRSPKTTIQRPRNYEAATLEQQMTLSLLAAQKIINSLTLTLSSTQRKVTREWQLTQGLMTLQAEYQSPDNNYPNCDQSVYLKLYLPQGGSLSWESSQGSAIVQRQDSGYLSVELFDCQRGQMYPVTLRLCDPQEIPLKFAVIINN